MGILDALLVNVSMGSSLIGSTSKLLPTCMDENGHKMAQILGCTWSGMKFNLNYNRYLPF